MKVYLLCGGYYPNFDYNKSLVEINGEKLIDRTIRLLNQYDTDTIVCCNHEETVFDRYKHLLCFFTYNHVTDEGYYLDAFDAVPFKEQCIFLFGDVYYTEEAIKGIIDRFNATSGNIFICNEYPFNKEGLRQGEPFGWIVKDPQEFQWAVKLGKRFQDRGMISHSNGVPTNWELAHIINGLGVNDFCLRREGCLVIDDLTIDVDDPSAIERTENKIKGSD